MKPSSGNGKRLSSNRPVFCDYPQQIKMHPILFKIGGLTFYSHGLFIVLGIIVGALLVYLLASKSGLDKTRLIDNIIYVCLIGVIGARVTYFILYPGQFESISQIIFLWQGGLVSYGGFVLGGLALFFLLRLQKQPILKWLDLFAIGLPFGLLLGRIGDWLAGDYGIFPLAKKAIFGIQMPNPLVEAGFCALVVLILLSIFWFGRDKVKDGTIFLLSVLIYSGGRFIIDFWRYEAPVLFGLSAGQVFNIIVFLLATVIFILKLMREKKGAYNEFAG